MSKTKDNKKADINKSKSSPSSSSKTSEDELTRLAVQEIMKETEFAKIKAKEFGAIAYRKCPLRKTNKRFLNTTISSIVKHNEKQKSKHLAKSGDKLKELDRRDKLRNSKKKFGDRKHEYRRPEKKKEKDE